MSRIKTKNTIHSYERAAERCGWNKKQAQEIMRRASKNGVSADNLSPGPLKDYITEKQVFSPHKRIKVYQNHIFVFASTSTRCITVYPVPEEFLHPKDEISEG